MEVSAISHNGTYVGNRPAETNKHVEAALHVADSVLCCIALFPAMVFYWRGIWDLYGVYILPGEEPANFWIMTGIGSCSIFGYLIMPILDIYLPKLPRALYEIAVRLYMYVYAIVYMGYWRGVWCVADYYLDPLGWRAGVVGYVICQGTLIALRAARSTVFTPYIVVLDTRKEVLRACTRFKDKTEPSLSRPSSVVLYTLDCLLTHFIIGTLTILTWRMLWNITNAFMVFKDHVTSDWICLVIGYAAAIIIFSLEESLAKISLYMEGRYKYGKLAWENVVYLVVQWAAVFLWRGGWNLNAEFIIKDPMLGGWVNHAIGTVLLMGLQVFSFVAGCGCTVDGFDEGREGIFPTKYLRHYILPMMENNQKKRTSGEGNEAKVAPPTPPLSTASSVETSTSDNASWPGGINDNDLLHNGNINSAYINQEFE